MDSEVLEPGNEWRDERFTLLLNRQWCRFLFFGRQAKVKAIKAFAVLLVPYSPLSAICRVRISRIHVPRLLNRR